MTGAGGRPARTCSKWSTREVVLFLEKKGQAQFQAHTHQAGLVNQDGPEGGDGPVQEGLSVFIGSQTRRSARHRSKRDR